MPRRRHTLEEVEHKKRIGLHIRAARTKAGLTQRALGELLDRQVQTVCDWEAGKASPSPTLLSKLAEITGESVSFFATAPLTKKDSLEALAKKLGITLGHRRLEALNEIPERKLRNRIDALLGEVADQEERPKAEAKAQ